MKRNDNNVKPLLLYVAMCLLVFIGLILLFLEPAYSEEFPIEDFIVIKGCGIAVIAIAAMVCKKLDEERNKNEERDDDDDDL